MSNRIAVDACRVGTMMRDVPEGDQDSGWVFLAGDESQAYLDDAANLGSYDVNTVASCDPSIMPYLYALPGQRFDRDRVSGLFFEAEDSTAQRDVRDLPQGITVVQGRVSIVGAWSIVLPTPFRRRHAPECIRLWRPALTLCVEALRNPGATFEETFVRIRSGMSPAAFDTRLNDRGLAQVSYRLHEDTTEASVPSLYASVIAAHEHLRFGIYADSEHEIENARSMIDSVIWT